MTRFSQTCIERGIVYYLAMVGRMQIIVSPVIKRYGGSVVKFEADNCFSRFLNIEDAIEAAIAIQLAVAAANDKTHKDLDIELSCGIDYGDFLLTDAQDYFGNPVNRASKIGEDIASAGEILVSRDALENLKNPERFPFENKRCSISGMTLDVCRILY
jgi:class 3 adenylate cyclase